MKRSFIIIGVIVLLAGVAGYLLFRQSTQGRLEIASEAGAELSVWVQDDTVVKKVGKTKAALRLAPGNYTAVAEKDGRETQAMVTVAARETTSIVLALKNRLEGERLGAYTARDITASGSTLAFVNASARQLYTYTPPAQVQRLLPELYPVSRVYWSGPDSGIIQRENGTLVAVANGRSTPVLMPEGSETLLKPVVAMAEGGSFAIAYDGAAYYYASAASEPKKVAELEDRAARIALSAQGMLFVYSDPAASAGESEGGAAATMVNVHSGATVITPLANTSANEAIWSPDGKRLVMVSNSDILVYDLADNRSRTVSKQSAAGSSMLVWSDLETLVYPQTRGLYSLNTVSGVANLLVEADNIEHPGAVSVVGDYLYAATTPKPIYGSVGQIYRYRLK